MNPKGRCGECNLPLHLCICEHIPEIDNQTFCTFLVHQDERFKYSNTSYPCFKALKNSEYLIRGLGPDLGPVLSLKRGYTPVFLYPDANALPLNSLDPQKGPYHLIIPDGTWRQAKRTKRRFPNLKEVQSFYLPEDPEKRSSYSLRRSKMDGQVCTMEAVGLVLGYFESPLYEKQLFDFVKFLVSRVEALPNNLSLIHI